MRPFNMRKLLDMRKLSTLLLAVLSLTALTGCGDGEDDLTNSIDFTSPYTIADDPNDVVQHECYLLYEKYGVPVFFNDTISTRLTGKNLQGQDVYTTETIDLNWNFQSHDSKSVTYKYKYFTTQEEKLHALEFAKDYLSRASTKMRPFCILLVDSAMRNGAAQQYINGFRCLVVGSISSFTAEQTDSLAQSILRTMVLSRVKVNDGTNGGLGCVWGVVHNGMYWKPSRLFNEGIAEEYITYSWKTNITTVEEFEAERSLIISQIGKYGFICGDTDYNGQLDHVNSPASISQDLTFYVNTMLSIGRTEFLNRYGASTMVKKKFDILANYIEGELLINLDF